MTTAIADWYLTQWGNAIRYGWKTPELMLPTIQPFTRLVTPTCSETLNIEAFDVAVRAVRVLDSNQYETVYLKYVNRKSCRKISEVLGISKDEASYRLKYSLNRVSGYLQAIEEKSVA